MISRIAVALTRVQSDEHHERLDQHRAALEDFGHAVLVMRGGDVPTGDEALSNLVEDAQPSG